MEEVVEEEEDKKMRCRKRMRRSWRWRLAMRRPPLNSAVGNERMRAQVVAARTFICAPVRISHRTFTHIYKSSSFMRALSSKTPCAHIS